MIRYDEIEQGTIEWFGIKWGKIGGSSSKGLHTKGDTLFIELLSQHLEEFEPDNSFINDAMERGNNLEPFARDYISEYTGLEFKETGWLQSKKNELLGISPDGITDDNFHSCEIKCFGRKKHTEVLLKDEIPLENIHQCIHYFTVNPQLKEHYFIAFRPESPKHFVKKLTLNSIVNIGTPSKPKAMTIGSVRDYSLEFADEMLFRINVEKENIIF